jgi:outer membrane receptor for ferrienterochelin and colicins
MKILYSLVLAFMPFCAAFAQNTLEIYVKDKASGEALIGASIQFRNNPIKGISGNDGYLKLENLPSGNLILKVKYVGYEEFSGTVSIPAMSPFIVEMEPHEEDMEEITILSTRSSRTIGDIPTRVEFIAGEELNEKINMRPGDIRLVLSESTGIQTQITSAASGNASIRIQGMDGRYTQILKDGFPLYSGAASGLGLLQIPPLDLKQIELIKGSSSTLYGGGAIAGMVNLISKTPGEEPSLEFLLNASNAGGLDASGFYSTKAEKIGFTTFASLNKNKAYDPSDIRFSAIPEFERITFNPRLFIYPSADTDIVFGINTTFEDRIGGSMNYLEGNRSQSTEYFEQNISKRISSQFNLTHKGEDGQKFQVKNSLNYFDRALNSPGYGFDGEQFSSFTELNYAIDKGGSEWIGGLNLWTENFSEKLVNTAFGKRDYMRTTYGAFIQNTFEASEKFHIESGLRADYTLDYGWAILPRISALYKFNPNFSSRLGGGFGYKAPTLFTEESERIQYRNLMPLQTANTMLEKSYGANWDLNYKMLLTEELTLSINQLFFYTYLNNPLQLLAIGQFVSPSSGSNALNQYRLENSDGYLRSAGSETNLKVEYDHIKLFVGYTYTDTKIFEENESRINPLTPKHRLNSVLMFEKHDAYRIGLEGYYFSEQWLNDGATGQSYWLLGIMAEKMWERFSIYINFENFLDARQTRFDTILSGSMINPQLRDIYAPLEGFVINGGIKFRIK